MAILTTHHFTSFAPTDLGRHIPLTSSPLHPSLGAEPLDTTSTSMAFPWTPDHRTSFDWSSPKTSSSHDSSLSPRTGRRMPTDTPCTRFSMASSPFPNTDTPSKNWTAKFTEKPSRSTRSLRKRLSVISTLFRPKSIAFGQARKSEPSTAAVSGGQSQPQTVQSMGKLQWSVSENNVKRPKISPPRPPRPEVFLPPKLRHSVLPSLLESNDSVETDEERLGSRVLSSPPLPSLYEKVEDLAALDSEKGDKAFTRLDPTGWNRVVPKQWIEDNFSLIPCETDEDRSVYSQDNGEEEAKQRPVSRHSSSVTETGFLAGEATPFDLLNSQVITFSNERESSYFQVKGLQMRKSQVRQSAIKPRRPFERASLSSLTPSHVRNWLSSIRPASTVILPSPSIPNSKVKSKYSSNISLPGPGFLEVPDPPNVDVAVAALDGEPYAAEPSPIAKARPTLRPTLSSLWRTSEASLVPALPPSTQNESTTTPQSIISSPQACTLQAFTSTSSPNASWSTIRCQGEPDLIANPSLQEFLESDPNPDTDTTISNRQTRRQSDKNKPLPLLPDEVPPSLSPESSDEAVIDVLCDEMEDILDLYYHSDSDTWNSVHTIHTAIPAQTTKNAQTPTIPPPPRSHRPHPSNPSPKSSTSTSLPLAVPLPSTRPDSTTTSTCENAYAYASRNPSRSPSISTAIVLQKLLFTSEHHILYTPLTYPEVSHTRGKSVGLGGGGGRESEAGRRRKRERVVLTFVDGWGGTWI